MCQRGLGNGENKGFRVGPELIAVLVVVLLAGGAFALFHEEPTIKGVATTIDDLPTQVILREASLWQIVILRKSGYLHDQREVRGGATHAIANALTSCRRSGIYSIVVTRNEPDILEFFSANQEGRGKAIGGFRITPLNEAVASVVAHPVRLGAADLEDQVIETKRNIARVLLERIKPGLNQKQRDVLGSLAEDDIINAMADQITGQDSDPKESLTFVIPIQFTDSEGTYYENMRLVLNSDVPSADLNQPRADFRSDKFGFPEQDAWEGTVYELGGRPQRCDLKLAFRYTDSNGATTSRQIRTKAFVPGLNDDHLVLGFCNYRKANRSFATSRMRDVVDLDTGECLDDIDAFLNAAYEASDYKKLDDFIDDRMNVVECLLYTARLDGNLTKPQKTIIYDYVRKVSGAPFVTDTVIQSVIKDFAEDLSPQNFRKLLKQMQKEMPESFADVSGLAEKIVSARRGDTAGGRAALALIMGSKR